MIDWLVDLLALGLALALIVSGAGAWSIDAFIARS
jgi:uncharacterized membrane protein YphA (DoxX/SURF4 family)